ncbi:histidine kinase [Streptacidiphilus sp. MAP5-3]|uniref:histidine kinase n=1 Tax=unclassified Streptacidiphilus TaxID=2643834 RepID=UPI003515FAB8
MNEMSDDMAHDDKMLFLDVADTEAAAAVFDEITQLPTVTRAVLLERDADGRISVPKDYDPQAGGAMFGLGAVGALVGLLGGPMGVAIGLTLGSGVGAVADGREAEDETDALIGLTAWVDPGHCLVTAEMVESDPRAVDAIAARHQAALHRVLASDAAADLEKLRAAAQSRS